jgi:hypothetical protein
MTSKAWGTAGTDSTPQLGAWDMVDVAGVALPGLAKVSGPGVEHAIDVKKSPGKNGATITDLGRSLGRFTITLVLWSAAQWDEFIQRRGMLQPLSRAGQLQALKVRHPAINALGIDSLYFTRVGVPHPGSAVGTYEVELECLEFRLPQQTSAGGAQTPKRDFTTLDSKAPNFATSDGRQVRVKATAPSNTNKGP